jgi:hypothetical protein
VRLNNTNFKERFRQQFKTVALYQRQRFYALRQRLKSVAYSKKRKKKKPEVDATMGMARPSYGRYTLDGASFLWTLHWGWRVPLTPKSSVFSNFF